MVQEAPSFPSDVYEPNLIADGEDVHPIISTMPAMAVVDSEHSSSASSSLIHATALETLSAGTVFETTPSVNATFVGDTVYAQIPVANLAEGLVTTIPTQQVGQSPRELGPSLLQFDREFSANSARKNRANQTTKPWYQWYKSVAFLRMALTTVLMVTSYLIFWTGGRDLIARDFRTLPAGYDTIRIIRQPGYIMKLAPWPIKTDVCTYRIVNTCRNRRACSGNQILFYSDLTVEDDPKNKTTTLIMTPTSLWPYLFENYQNLLQCDIILVVDTNMSIEITSSSDATVIAEDVALRRLILTGSGGLGNFWLESKNLFVSERLEFRSSQGGALIDGLSMPSSASAALTIRDGTIDIITNDSPTFQVSSVNDAVCMVGEFEGSPREEQVSARNSDSNLTVRSGAFRCADLHAAFCNRPSWNLSVTGALGSVGIHIGSHEFPEVVSGSAFSDSNFVAIDHSLITKNGSLYDFAYISFKGIGIMRGNIQAQWSQRKIWFFINADLTWLAMYSFFVVLPAITEYSGTISCCPAHGRLAKNDLIRPLEKAMGGLRKGDSEGYWILRNIGSIRDSMQPLDLERGYNVRRWTMEGWRVIASTDQYVPNCPYCADNYFWKSAYYVGSFGKTTGKCEGFPDPKMCLIKSCSTDSMNMFTLVNIGMANCFPNEAVAGVMSNNVSFVSDDKCWTSANFICPISTRSGAMVGPYFANGQASTMTAISISVGILAGLIGVYLSMLALESLIRTSIVKLIITDPEVLSSVKKTMQLASSFALLRRPKNSSTNLEYDQADDWKEVYQARYIDSDWKSRVDVEHTHADYRGQGRKTYDGPEEVLMSYLAMNLREEEDSFTGLYIRQTFGALFWRKRSESPSKTAQFLRRFLALDWGKLREVKSRDLASFWLIQTCSWILNLPKGNSGKLETDEHLMAWTKNGRPPLLTEYEYNIVFLWEKPHAAARRLDVNNEPYDLRNSRKIFSWDEKIVAGENVNKTVSQCFEELQLKVKELRYLLQRLHLQITPWYMIDKSMRAISFRAPSWFMEGEESEGTSLTQEQFPSPEQSPAEKSEAIYQRMARKLELETRHSALGEVQTVLAQTIFILLPCGFLLLIMMTLYYIRMKDRGTAGQGSEGDLAILQNWVGKFFTIFIMSVNYLSLCFYFWRTRDWTLTPGVNTSGCVNQSNCPFQKYNKWYKWRMGYNLCMNFVWALTMLFVVAYPVIVSIWILLGMFLSPEDVASFATAITGLIIHVITFYNTMSVYLNDARLELKTALQELNKKRQQAKKQQNKGAVAAEDEEGAQKQKDNSAGAADSAEEEQGTAVPEHTVDYLLAEYGISSLGIIWAILLSVFLMMLIMLAMFLGILAFTAETQNTGYQAVINSIMVGMAVVGTSLSSSGIAVPEIRHVVEQIMKKYTSDGFSFSLNEGLAQVLNRAEKTHVSSKSRRASEMFVEGAAFELHKKGF